jgi:hypothetical protein
MITRMMAKQMTNKQVSSVLDSIITNVVLKNQKRVSWMPGGIQEARTFEIEPWRTMNKKPESQIKSYDEIKANPFTLPLKMKHMKPYFDHSTWVKPKPVPPTTCCSGPTRPRTRSQTYMTQLTAIMEASDCMVKCEPIFEQPRLARCDKTVTLAEVYKIVEEIDLATQMYGSYDKFLEESEKHECGVKAKMD